MADQHKTSASEFIDHGSESYSFLPNPIIDALVQVVIELGTETWITRRRMMVMERVMAERGVLASEEIETYVPTPEDQAAWRQERDRMLKSVYSALARRPQAGDAAAVRAKEPNAPKVAPRNVAPPRARVTGPSGVR